MKSHCSARRAQLASDIERSSARRDGAGAKQFAGSGQQAEFALYQYSARAKYCSSAAGQDIAIGAFDPGAATQTRLVQAADSLIEGLHSLVVRLIVVGGAGSLEVAPGIQLADTRDFPAG